MTSMNVSLPEDLKAYVESQTRQGYSTPSEYVRELIRSDRKEKERERLDALLVDGLHSGDPTPVDAQFWNALKRDALKVAKGRAKGTSRK
jgi:antitoxin ParD1/3/4